MPKNSTFLALLLAASLAAGCSDARKTANSKLLGAADTARRYYNNATSLMSSPQFLDLSVKPPRAPRGTKISSTQKLVAATEPALDNQIPQLLTKAKTELQTALNENAEAASDTIKANAYQLLGDVQHAIGQYQSLSADLALARAADDREEALDQAASARNLVSLARFQAALARMPKSEVTKMRQDAEKAVAAANEAIAKHQSAISGLDQANAQLLETDKTLLEQASELNDQAEQSNAAKKLELMTKAEALKAKVTANSSQISSNQQAARNLTTQIAFENINLATGQDQLKALDQHLARMDQKGQEVSAARQQNMDAAAKALAAATTAAAQSAGQCEQAAKSDVTAAVAFTEAIKLYKQAEQAVNAEMQAAQTVQGQKPTKIDSLLTSLSDDQHLVNVITARAASELRLGDLYAGQLAVLAANRTLNDEMAKANAAVNGGAAASQPTTASADPAKISKLADEAYRGAIKDLESVAKGRLTQSPSKNTQWIYQGLLARAYLGQYQLTGDMSSLRKAGDIVDKATQDREHSPYVSAIVELSQLIHSHLPAAASAPASMPVNRPAAPAARGAATPAPAAPGGVPTAAPGAVTPAAPAAGAPSVPEAAPVAPVEPPSPGATTPPGAPAASPAPNPAPAGGATLVPSVEPPHPSVVVPPGGAAE